MIFPFSILNFNIIHYPTLSNCKSCQSFLKTKTQNVIYKSPASSGRQTTVCARCWCWCGPWATTSPLPCLWCSALTGHNHHRRPAILAPFCWGTRIYWAFSNFLNSFLTVYMDLHISKFQGGPSLLDPFRRTISAQSPPVSLHAIRISKMKWWPIYTVFAFKESFSTYWQRNSIGSLIFYNVTTLLAQFWELCARAKDADELIIFTCDVMIPSLHLFWIIR